MHAGDALWKLYALAELLSLGRDCSKLAHTARDCCIEIGTLIGVPAPSPAQLADTMTSLGEGSKPPESAYYNEEQPKKRRSANNRKELVEAIALLTQEMMDDVAFEWVTSGILESINEQSSRENDPFVTPKQCSAVLNIADRDESFMMTFESDHPEELRLITEHARK